MLSEFLNDREKRMANILGKVVIVFSFLMSMSPFWLFVTIPSFLLGVVFVWLQKVSIASNIIWTVLPIFIWYPAVGLVTYSSTSMAQKFDFYFEPKFTGPVIVVNTL